MFNKIYYLKFSLIKMFFDLNFFKKNGIEVEK